LIRLGKQRAQDLKMNMTNNPLPLRVDYWNETYGWNETTSFPILLSPSPNTTTTTTSIDDDAMMGSNYTTYPPTTTYYEDPEYYDPAGHYSDNTQTNYVAEHNMIVVVVLIGLIVVLCTILGFVALPPIMAMIQRKMPIPQKRIDRRYATIDGWLITKVCTLFYYCMYSSG
jgi:hypothetical protein